MSFAGQEFVKPVAQVVLAQGDRLALSSIDYAALKLAVEQGYLDQPSDGGRPVVTKLGVELLALAALR
jgi:hypothetical protein